VTGSDYLLDKPPSGCFKSVADTQGVRFEVPFSHVTHEQCIMDMVEVIHALDVKPLRDGECLVSVPVVCVTVLLWMNDVRRGLCRQRRQNFCSVRTNKKKRK